MIMVWLQLDTRLRASAPFSDVLVAKEIATGFIDFILDHTVVTT